MQSKPDGLPSARLFAERAAAGSPGFAVTTSNAADGAELCRRLDGLPLAIELAAARIRAFSPAELVSHLDHRFDLLTASAKSAGSRHISLEGALRWSYELLDGDERLLFERCSVFPGDFDYDTAGAVVTDPPLAPADLARLFPRLLDRSLISANHMSQSTEYRMLDSIRQFAHDRLLTRGEADQVQARHARWHLDRAVSLATDLQGRDQPAALGWFDSRWADLRAAMQWTLDEQDVESAWRFVTGIGIGWDILGMRGELFDWLGALLGQPLPSGPLGVAAAGTAAFLLWYQDPRQALVLSEAAYAQIADEDDRQLALAHLVLGRTMGVHRGETAAIDHLEHAAATFQELGDQWHYAVALEFLSSVAAQTETALTYLERAANLFGRLGDRVLRANCLNQMAQWAIETNSHLDATHGWLAEAHQLAELTGNHHEWLHAELFQARLDQRRGDHASTGPRYLRLLAEFRRIGDRRCMSRCLLGLGWAAIGQDDQTAKQHLTECAETAHRAGSPEPLSASLRLLAQIEHATGNPRRAACLLGAADAAAGDLDAARCEALPPVADLRRSLEQELDTEELSSALAKGRTTPVGQLITP